MVGYGILARPPKEPCELARLIGHGVPVRTVALYRVHNTVRIWKTGDTLLKRLNFSCGHIHFHLGLSSRIERGYFAHNELAFVDDVVTLITATKAEKDDY